MTEGSQGPLDGITVVDLTAALAGPYATLLLAGLGARVIKVENPHLGDIARENSPYLTENGLNLVRTAPEDRSVSILARSRGKESVTIDLKTEEGKQLLFDLVERADVLIENFAPGVTRRLGIGFDEVHRVNPRLVYTSITGFGTSNGRESKAMDATIQALSGIMMTMGASGDGPVRIGIPIADLTAPLYAVIGTIAAIFRARESGVGQFVDISMLGALASLVSAETIDAQVAVGYEARTGDYMPRLAPFGCFECSDGWYALAAPTDAQAYGVLRTIGREDLVDSEEYGTRNARASNADELHALVVNWSRSVRRDDALACLRQNGVPAEPVLTPAQAIRDRGVLARGEVTPIADAGGDTLYGPGVPIVFSETKADLSRPAPALGEHTDTVLTELLGIPRERIEHLRARGIV